MTQVPGVFPPAPPPAEPAVDRPPIELADELPPPEQEALPQGVLDLLASLAPRRPPMLAAGRGVSSQATSARGEVAPEGPPTDVPNPVHAALERTAKRAGSTLHYPTDPRLAPVMPVMPANVGLVAMVRQVRQPVPLIERTWPMAGARGIEQPVPEAAEPSRSAAGTPSSKRPIESPAPTVVAGDVELPRARAVPLAGSTPPVMAPAVPLPEPAVEDMPGPSREVLQVPFNKGAVSGQVSVTRAQGESAQQLVLSADNAQVLEHLREPFAQKAEPSWLLADSGEERQQRHGSQPSPEEEQADTGERPS